MAKILGFVVAFVVLYTLLVLFQGFIIKMAWNYVLVDTAGVNVNHLTLTAGMVVAVALDVVGGFFKNTSSKK